MVWSSTSADGVSVERTRTSADGAIAGIVAADIESADNTGATTASDDNGRRNWGYVQVYGIAVANIPNGGDNAAGAGDLFVTSRDPANITGLETPLGHSGGSVGETTDVTQVLDISQAASSAGGFFVDDPSGKTSTTVFIRLE